jgi:CDP-6-deoxy-D-xylo-4-hexulose-3-dehydrase
MKNNITRQDLDAAIRLLAGEVPVLTQSSNVRAFEKDWSAWLGVRYSVFVNSGSSANLITLAALRETRGSGKVIVPPLTWVSDIASVLQAGFEPVFVDINPRTLGMDNVQVVRALTPDTRAVFLTHVLGYNALSQPLLDELTARGIPLLEDVCESHGATFQGRKLGTFGLMSNFSFYYAHHLSTIEGGMVCTDDPQLYEVLRMLRSHGMVRECSSPEARAPYLERHPDLNPDLIFAFPAYNVRLTEINVVIGRSQLNRLHANNWVRTGPR